MFYRKLTSRIKDLLVQFSCVGGGSGIREDLDWSEYMKIYGRC